MYSARLNKLIKDWKGKLNQNFTVDAILMASSNAFGCIPDDLMIAKLAAYGFISKKIGDNTNSKLENTTPKIV